MSATTWNGSWTAVMSWDTPNIPSGTIFKGSFTSLKPDVADLFPADPKYASGNLDYNWNLVITLPNGENYNYHGEGGTFSVTNDASTDRVSLGSAKKFFKGENPLGIERFGITFSQYGNPPNIINSDSFPEALKAVSEHRFATPHNSVFSMDLPNYNISGVDLTDYQFTEVPSPSTAFVLAAACVKALATRGRRKSAPATAKANSLTFEPS